MLKFVGAAVILAVVVVLAGVSLGFINFGVDASVTPKGQQQLQDVRNTVADQVRGK